MPSKKKVLKEYLAFRSLKNKTKGGMRDIEYHINKFLTHTKRPLDKFDEELLINYVGKINEKYKTSMANTVKSSFLKNFIKWYFVDWSSRFRNLSAICETEKPAPTYSPDDMLSEEDVQKLIKSEEKIFWKAYFSTLFYGGCRPVEVAKLKHSQVSFEDEGAYITIYSKKNKREFVKYVPKEVAFYLEKIKDNDSEYVFCNPRTKDHISVKGAYWKLRELSKKVLGKKINLYILRHSIATIIYNKEHLKDDDAANQMGHSKSMKKTYVHNNKKKLKENARKIYFEPEELPPEKKHELELKIERMKEETTILMKKMREEFEKESEKFKAEVLQTIKT